MFEYFVAVQNEAAARDVRVDLEHGVVARVQVHNARLELLVQHVQQSGVVSVLEHVGVGNVVLGEQAVLVGELAKKKPGACM